MFLLDYQDLEGVEGAGVSDGCQGVSSMDYL
jgi:hypothetical protein